MRPPLLHMIIYTPELDRTRYPNESHITLPCTWDLASIGRRLSSCRGVLLALALAANTLGQQPTLPKGVYLIGNGVSAPSVARKVQPDYSEEARKAKLEGTVVLSLVVNERGRPQNLKILRALGLGLDEEAIGAVEKWKFKPGMKDGKPVAVMVTIEVNFQLIK